MQVYTDQGVGGETRDVRRPASRAPFAWAAPLLAPWVLGTLCACAGVGHLEDSARADRWALAEKASLTGDWTSAASLWNEIRLEEDRAGARPALETARALHRLGQPDDALALLGNALERYPEDAPLWALKGQVLDEQGYRRAAEADLRESLRLDPNQAGVWLRLARVQLALDCPLTAREALKRADGLASDSDRPATGTEDQIALWSARTARCLEDYASAQDHYAELVRRAHEGGIPPHPQSRSGSLAEGVLPAEPTFCELLVEAASLFTTPGSPLPDGAVLDLAATWSEEAARLDPQFVCAYFVCAVLAERRGHSDAAVKAYRRVVELDGHHLGATTNLALLYRRLERWPEAEGMLQRAIALETDPSRRAQLQELEREAAAALVAPTRDPQASSEGPEDSPAR